jgi:adenylate cyclase
MKIEIERKFLVKGDFKKFSIKKINIKQAYLTIDPERSVRVRVSDVGSFLTIKGKSNNFGLSRKEFEYQIPDTDAEELLKLSVNYIIEKNRYIIPHGNLIFEVDEFLNLNEGLIIAEVELLNENQHITIPEWLGEEITGNKNYYNLQLSVCPFSLRKFQQEK